MKDLKLIKAEIVKISWIEAEKGSKYKEFLRNQPG